MEKVITVEKKIQFCDICTDAVGEFQLTEKFDKHICSACYGYRFIAWANANKSDYEKKGSYKFDYEKINKIVLEEMKLQVKSGIGKWE